jgi:thiol:disulfide interchange protein DsbA
MNLKQKLRALLGALLICTCGVATAQTNLKGSDYQRISPPRPVATGERIEIIEFFYYGCPICYEFQPHLSRWLVQGPDYISIRRVPTLPSEGSDGLEGWVRFARLHYTLEALGQIGRLHWPIYDNFHFDGVQLNDEKVMVEWVSKNGIDREKFLAVYRSPEIQAKLDEVRKLMVTYDVRSVPTMVVDGKYLSTARMAGGTRQLIQVVDNLTRLARKERPR